MQNLNLVHLNGLRALEAVGRLGSLQAAAEELGVSIGAVSQQVIKAEAQLGAAMFIRTPKGMIPTERGASVLERLGEGFRKLSEAVAITRQRDNDCLTISVAPVFASRWLVRRFDGFIREHPEIQLRIDATMQLIDPAGSDVDLAIRVGRGDWDDVRSELILPQQVFPVCAPQMAARLKRPADLLDLPVVADSRAMFSWDIWLQAAGLAGHSIVPRHSFNEASLALDAAIAGQGVMLAWQTLAVDAIQAGWLSVPFPIRVPTGFGHYFVTAKGVREPTKVRLFKAWLRRELAESMAGLDGYFERKLPLPNPSPQGGGA